MKIERLELGYENMMWDFFECGFLIDIDTVESLSRVDVGRPFLCHEK